MKIEKLDDVSNRIVEAVLAERILSKKELVPKVRTLIAAFVRPQQPTNYDKLKTDTGKLALRADIQAFEKEFWKNKLKKLVSDDDFKLLARELDALLNKKNNE